MKTLATIVITAMMLSTSEINAKFPVYKTANPVVPYNTVTNSQAIKPKDWYETVKHYFTRLD